MAEKVDLSSSHLSCLGRSSHCGTNESSLEVRYKMIDLRETEVLNKRALKIGTAAPEHTSRFRVVLSTGVEG